MRKTDFSAWNSVGKKFIEKKKKGADSYTKLKFTVSRALAPWTFEVA